MYVLPKKPEITENYIWVLPGSRLFLQTLDIFFSFLISAISKSHKFGKYNILIIIYVCVNISSKRLFPEINFAAHKC